MGEQLRMFRLTPAEVELKARQIVDCQRQLVDADNRRKTAKDRLKDSAEARELRAINDEIKSIRETAAKLVADLDGEAIPKTDT